MPTYQTRKIWKNYLQRHFFFLDLSALKMLSNWRYRDRLVHFTLHFAGSRVLQMPGWVIESDASPRSFPGVSKKDMNLSKMDVAILWVLSLIFA